MRLISHPDDTLLASTARATEALTPQSDAALPLRFRIARPRFRHRPRLSPFPENVDVRAERRQVTPRQPESRAGKKDTALFFLKSSPVRCSTKSDKAALGLRFAAASGLTLDPSNPGGMFHDGKPAPQLRKRT